MQDSNLGNWTGLLSECVMAPWTLYLPFPCQRECMIIILKKIVGLQYFSFSHAYATMPRKLERMLATRMMDL